MSTVPIARRVNLNVGARLRVSIFSFPRLLGPKLPFIFNRGPYSLHESKLTIFINPPNGMNEIFFHVIRARRNVQMGYKADVQRLPSFKYISCIIFKVHIVSAAEYDFL